MKTRIMLSISVMRRNRVFSVGLFLLYTVLAAICIVNQSALISIRTTVDRFIRDYQIPDIWVISDPTPDALAQPIADFEDVVDFEQGVTADLRCKVGEDGVFVLRLFTVAQDSFRSLYEIETAQCPEGTPAVSLTVYFARQNGIKAGDTVELETKDGFVKCFVSALVSAPESMLCSRNSASWCDFEDFGYIYMDRAEADGLLGTAGISNVRFCKVKDGCPEARREELLGEVADACGGTVYTAERFETSDAKQMMDDELKQVEMVTRFLPAVVFLMGLFFSFLFLSQVMRNQQKTIGLLRGLGYTPFQTLRVFVSYCAAICVGGIAAGAGLGVVLTRFCVSIYQERYSLPAVEMETDGWSLALMLAGMLAVSVLACVLQIGLISGISPAQAYSGISPNLSSDLPGWLQRLKCESLTKASVISVYRNKKRFLFSVLSVSACLLLSLVCIAIVFSNNAAQPAAFGGRFRYDLLISHTGGDAFTDVLRQTDGIAAAESVITAEDTVFCFNKSQNVQIHATVPDSKMLCPQDADGTVLSPGDGIILDEYTAQQLGVAVGDGVVIRGETLAVTGIAREIVNATEYVSPETAERLGYGAPNMSAVTFADGADPEAVGYAVTEHDGYAYTVSAAHQSRSLADACAAVNSVLYIFIALSFALGIIIISIMVIITVGEKKKEYAILIALGIPSGRFLKVAAVENIARFILSVLIGVTGGCALSFVVLNGMSSIRTTYPPTQMGTVCVLACLCAMLYLVIGVFQTFFRMKRVDPAVAMSAA